MRNDMSAERRDEAKAWHGSVKWGMFFSLRCQKKGIGSQWERKAGRSRRRRPSFLLLCLYASLDPLDLLVAC